MPGVGMISHYPLATLLPWPAGLHQHCPDLDCTLLLEGEGGVALQRYQPRSPESSPRHWVSTFQDDYLSASRCLLVFWDTQVLPVLLNNVAAVEASEGMAFLRLGVLFGVKALDSLDKSKDGKKGKGVGVDWQCLCLLQGLFVGCVQ